MTKHFYLYGLTILLLSVSCKPLKTKGTAITMLSTKKIVTAYDKALFSKNTLEARINARYKDSKTIQNLTIKLRLKKDEVIWMSASFLGIPLAKIKITPTSVQFYEKVKKTFFDGDFSLLSEVLGTELNFQQVQNMLLGQAVLPIDNKHVMKIDTPSYLVTPENQNAVFELFYWLNPTQFKLDKQTIKTQENQVLSVTYLDYQYLSKEYFPKTINIEAVQENKTTNIDLEYKQVAFDETLNFPFDIPSDYTEIRIKK